ncbi:hypothetical protein ACHQM5_011976 [Ranunculus cassubicifolius]
MAGAFISHVLEKIHPVLVPSELQQDVKAVVDFRENIEKLRSTFQMLQAVVEDAERKQVKSHAVKIWLARLKEVSYDADDLFDQWNTENQIAEKQGVGENHLAKKVRGIVKPFFERDHIVHKVTNMQERLDQIARDKAQFNLIEIQSSPEPRLETSSVINTEEVYGREDDKKVILSKLLSEGSRQVSHVPVISIVGTGGFGKTTLSQLVFNDHEVVAKFEKKMWVCVSQPFDMKKAVKGKLFFLVLDDVWGYKDELWRQLKLSLDGGSPGSRVLVTTRNESVAKQMSSSYTYRLKGLSDDDCWELFRRRALQGRKDPEKFEKIGKEISKKCKWFLLLQGFYPVLCH